MEIGMFVFNLVSGMMFFLFYVYKYGRCDGAVLFVFNYLCSIVYHLSFLIDLGFGLNNDWRVLLLEFVYLTSVITVCFYVASIIIPTLAENEPAQLGFYSTMFMSVLMVLKLEKYELFVSFFPILLHTHLAAAISIEETRKKKSDGALKMMIFDV